MSPLTPEQKARQAIDAALEAAGWCVQDEEDMNLGAGVGVAVREFSMARGNGRADYLLFVDGQAVGALEAKAEGFTLTGVEGQSRKYSDGLPDYLHAPVVPLPFLYESTGVETRFTNRLDPHPRSRRVFAPHRPETIQEWLAAEPLAQWIEPWRDAIGEAPPELASAGELPPSSLRTRLQTLPVAEMPDLWSNQRRAVANLEASLSDDRPRSLIQMSTGSGKSRAAVASIYRLIKFGGARRVLFLVDRSNLGKQAEDEFATYRSYDDNRKFTELYNVQRLTKNKIGSSSKVVITTIQRLYSMLRGEPELDPELEEESGFERQDPGPVQEVAYSAAIPPEYFDVIFIDECHRSIYTLWRQVLEYFDAYLVGLTATPAKHTFGFFNRNLVMEYNYEDAVADGVNVDFDIYRIRTRITEQGSMIEAGPGVVVEHRERNTRRRRWEAPDEDIRYTQNQLDRDVVAKDQIRTIVRTFKQKLFTEIFPGRSNVPKTLVFAKDDSHAEDVVEIFREEFARGNEFCSKITYKSTEKKAEDLIQDFRTGYNPRIAVTVDMIATGTDVRPIEIVMFLRTVKSRVLYEQMKGRGGRVVKPDELRSVTPDAKAKTHFVLLDCVGVSESPMNDTRPLDRKKFVSFKKLLRRVSHGGTDPELVSSLASRLARLDLQFGPPEHERVEALTEGTSLRAITRGMVAALDADAHIQHARERFALPPEEEPSEKQVETAARELITEAVKPLAHNPQLRKLLLELKQHFDQIIDEISQDELLEAAPAPEVREKARQLVHSFEDYLKEHRDEIDALQFFYSQPYERRLRFEDIRALADAIGAPPRNWTPERLWRAYEQLDADRVRGASSERLLTDVVSLVRYALHQTEALVPYGEQVHRRFEGWLAQQETAGREFSQEQLRWLGMIRDHVAQSLEIDVEDFDLTPFVEEGGLGKAGEVFGEEFAGLIAELNEVLAA
jgi:type I restriction enzyme, R subunit